MLFTSLEWVLFLLATLAVFHLAPRALRRWTMLAASVVFYATWSAPFLLLIAAQLCVDWTCGHLLGRITDDRRRKLLVAASVVVNLGTLCLFKYYGLFSRSLSAVGVDVPVVELTLPLAISFYTFESMSYTIDVYRRRLEPVRSPIHLALFITWFPHLVAGPIIRPSELVPQIDRVGPVDRDRFFSGLSLMVVGYAKKLLIADWLARVANPVFADPSAFTSLELLAGVYAYAFQIYCDFSAYTDIARGASRWFGIELPENFDAPYLSASITEFWRRWHMTLSHWLRDYLYVPLGGNRKGDARTYVNLMLTMLLGGLWHGASWTFLVWGGLHGLILGVERALGVKGDARHTGFALAWRRALTFHLVCLAWVFFRAESFTVAGQVLAGIASGGAHLVAGRVVPVVGTLALVVGYWALAPLRGRLLVWQPGRDALRQAGYIAALSVFVAALMLLGAPGNAFIYFQF